MKKPLTSFLFLAALAATGFAAQIRVATLNCYLLFDPAINHAGKVDEASPLTREQYDTKLGNLARMAKGYDVIGLQETGGRQEITDLADAMGYRWAFAKGRDTYTGQEVGLLYRPLPDWRYTVEGRVAALDRVVSKHLLVTATNGARRVHFLVVHLLRPIGENAARQGGQIEAINRWASEQLRNPATVVVVLGDTNSGGRKPVFAFGTEINELNGYQGTHLSGRPFDRMATSSGARWSKVEIVHPPYGRKPNDLQKKLWTDHFLLGGVLGL